MDSILKKLQEPKAFEAFIEESMKLSSYTPLWKNEISQVDYCAAKVYQSTIADYAAAIVGSVIDKNGEKPVHQMPTVAELTGTIGHMGDEWELDNDYLDQLYYLEGRYRNSAGRYTPERNQSEYDKLLTFAFRPFEKAVIAPHKRIDMLYFEGLFNGTQTVSRTNNKKSNVSYTFNLGVQKFKALTYAWGDNTNAANATPLKDIKQVVDYAKSKGRTIQRIRMSETTFFNMCQSDEIANKFKLNLNTVEVNSPALLSPAQVNAYLQSVLLPTIVVEPDRFAVLADGTSINLTVDNRVVFQCATNVAVLKVADSLELVDPLPGKTYTTHDDNLVGYWRDKTGRHTDYDMWAQPVFNGINDYFILKTDEVKS